MKPVINIIVSASHNLFRRGLIDTLENFSGFSVVAEAGDGEELVSKYFEYMPDIIVTDIILQKLNGIEALKKIISRDRSVNTLFVSAFEDLFLINECYKNGGKGFISRYDSELNIKSAIIGINNGKFYFPFTPRLINKNNNDYPSFTGYECASIKTALTNREYEIFTLYGHGYTNAKISNLLSISKKTVEGHEYTIKKKLSIDSTQRLLSVAAKHGLLYNRLL